ncbi:hypothetical protein JAAARDRAFT_203098 [Jaapia argillacea MUCL 33604]|uniref:F-box domain-containing protein n=1 Tax=Jaapia argillacea MUCL 33604 TaxID=933084 RepID=A0A067Q9G2_9AGAM|nr:hypothetical protein JAAARDRAFT_203098 [Jaapia argillacea MUCL 33604]
MMLPIELCAHIFSLVSSPQDLSVICLASSTCNQEARRVLYYDVHLHDGNLEPFLGTLVDNPSLGSLVHSLQTPVHLSNTNTPKVFAYLVNLRHLIILGRIPRLPEKYFQDCPFRLLSFSTRSFHIESTVNFLANQPEIRTWTHQQSQFYNDDTQPGVAFREDFLPNLEVMNVDAEVLMGFSSPRPVVSMKMRIWQLGYTQETRAFHQLRHFASSLTTLSIQYWDSSPNLSIKAILVVLGDGVPNLKCLYLAGIFDAYSTENMPIPKETAMLIGNSIPPSLPHLDTFVLALNLPVVSSPEIDDVDYALNFARLLMPKSSRLCTVVFPWEWDTDKQKLVAFVKGGDGEVSRESPMPSRFDSWLQFDKSF